MSQLQCESWRIKVLCVRILHYRGMVSCMFNFHKFRSTSLDQKGLVVEAAQLMLKHVKGRGSCQYRVVPGKILCLYQIQGTKKFCMTRPRPIDLSCRISCQHVFLFENFKVNVNKVGNMYFEHLYYNNNKYFIDTLCPIILNNACILCLTATTSTQLVDAYSSDSIIASFSESKVHDLWAFFLHAALLCGFVLNSLCFMSNYKFIIRDTFLAYIVVLQY